VSCVLLLVSCLHCRGVLEDEPLTEILGSGTGQQCRQMAEEREGPLTKPAPWLDDNQGTSTWYAGSNYAYVVVGGVG
jgi:hypothetical protein